MFIRLSESLETFIKTLFSLYSPAHLCGTGSWILCALFGWGADHIFCIVWVDSLLVSCFKRFLYQLVLTGMKGKDCHTSARTQSIRKLLHKFIQYFELMVNINTQCLEGSLAGFLNCLFLFFFRKEIKSFFDYLTQFCGSVNMISPADLIGNGFGEFLTIWFIRIFTMESLYIGNLS